MRYHKILKLAFFLPVIVTGITVCSNTNGKESNITLTKNDRDSVINRLELFLDSNYTVLDQYNRIACEQMSTNKDFLDAKARKKTIADSTAIIINAGTVSLTRQPNATVTQKKLIIRELYQSILRLEKEDSSLVKKIDNYSATLTRLDSSIKKAQARYNEVHKLLESLTSGLNKAGAFTINKMQFRYFIASPLEHLVQVHNSKKGTASSIARLKDQVLQKQNVLMVMNGGMFMPGYLPKGLLVENGKEMHPLDTLRPPNPDVNFYMLPNGIFSVGAKGDYTVEETFEFRTNNKKGTIKTPQFATQSGPMLLFDGKYNPNFRAASTNLNLRNGVGITKNNKAVFIISDSKVNFYDFACVFREIFQCEDALYLDGAISQMYINEKLLNGYAGKPIDGEFGPLISITEKKKP